MTVLAYKDKEILVNCAVLRRFGRVNQPYGRVKQKKGRFLWARHDFRTAKALLADVSVAMLCRFVCRDGSDGRASKRKASALQAATGQSVGRQ